jgi:hypothetical protein
MPDSTHPLYRRSKPKAQVRTDFASNMSHIDLTNAHLEPYGDADPVAKANFLFDARTAAAVSATESGLLNYLTSSPEPNPDPAPGLIAFPGLYLFSWDDVPGNDNGKLIKYLTTKFNVDWVKTAKFEKIDAGTTIIASTIKDSLWLRLNYIDPKVPKVDLIIDDGRTDELVAKTENSKLNIYFSLLEEKIYNDRRDYGHVYIPRPMCLGLMAFPDYFPSLKDAPFLWGFVSKAILTAIPGWCGTFGPGVDGTFDVASDHYEGNYDMSQMILLPIAYRYYDELSPEAREHLITVLLALGRIHRPREDDTLTSGRTPNDWSRAGFVSPLGGHVNIGETENHILMILTVRYLTNQLLYQRDHDVSHDNRRNGDSESGPHCTELLLSLLRDILRDDFSEYNAKPYQQETRLALLNLCSYAYDHEVRLAARMVLDYISAHIAVSSNDLRRMVPFRRRNETGYGRVAQLPGGFMDVGLLDWFIGADQMPEHFAMQTGNTRAYETPNYRLKEDKEEARRWEWAIACNGENATMEALSDYRLPPSIHDLFVHDLHRRFFQRLHRTPQPDVELTRRNCDNMEIYAGSPSYLITAGGCPATWAIDPRVLGRPVGSENDQQIGVAVTTSFMPTGQSAGVNTQNNASDLIQFSSFSDRFSEDISAAGAVSSGVAGFVAGMAEAGIVGGVIGSIGGALASAGSEVGSAGVANYGVAPDFACGHTVHLPGWVVESTLMQAVNRLRDLGVIGQTLKRPMSARSGDALAKWKKATSLMAAWNKRTGPVSVKKLNLQFQPSPPGSMRSLLYKMHEIMVEHLQFDGQFLFVNKGSSKDGKSERSGFYLALFKDGDFAAMEAFDTWLHPDLTFEQFKIDVLERNNNLTRIGLKSNVEVQYTTQNGNHLHFVIWNDGERGLADCGALILRIEYGTEDRTDSLGDAGKITGKFLNGTVMNSPADGVVEITNPFLGTNGTKITLDMSDKWHPKRTSETGEVEEAGSNHEVWVDFAWTGPCEGDFFRPFNSIGAAVAAVADGGVIKIMPRSTSERPSIQNNKRIRFVAPIGGVTIGVR